MRAPGEAPGMMALEIAMDEMAEKLGLDPVEFRIRNDTQVDPENPERPFSARPLITCLQRGRGAIRLAAARCAAGAGQGRALAGRSRHGGCVPQQPAHDIRRARAPRRGRTHHRRDGHDRHRHRQLHHHRPDGGGDDGRAHGPGGGAARRFHLSGLRRIRRPVRRQQRHFRRLCGLHRPARRSGPPRLGFNSQDADFADGQVRSGNRSAPLASAAARGEIVAEDRIEYGDLHKTHQQSTFGSHFVEVAVDGATGEVRVRRMLAVCAAGRILNPKSARSQVIGAMTMGVGAALMEHLKVDTRRGFFVNHDLASYEVPVHADIPHQEVIFLDETDPMSSPMKAKGVGGAGHLRCGGGGRQCHLQRHRRAGAGLPDHAGHLSRPPAGRRVTAAQGR